MADGEEGKGAPGQGVIDVVNFMPSYLAGLSSSDKINRDLLRLLNEEFDLGLEIPYTLGELADAAEKLANIRMQIAAADVNYRGELNSLRPEEGFQIATIMSKHAGNMEGLIAQLHQAEANLIELAAAYRGGSGSETISAILRPPRPSVDQLPTAEEFTGEFNNAYAMYLAEVGQSVGAAGRSYLEEQKGQIYQQYLNALGNFARFGVSPFQLKEVDRLAQPGAGAGEDAAKKALEAALGPGVKEPTTISGTPKSVAEQADQIGSGIPREFIALPRIDPLQFLRSTLMAEQIGIKSLGPTDRDIREGKRERMGFVGSPTVVG